MTDWQNSHECINPRWHENQKRTALNRWEFEKKELETLIVRFCELFGGDASEKIANMRASSRIDCGKGYTHFAKRLARMK